MAGSTWQPILVGDTAARAAAAVDAIGDALAAWPAFPAEDRFGSSLATGEAGLALLFSYLEEARPGAGYGRLAAERLDRAIERVATSLHRPGLYQGFTGIAWTIEHLRRRRPAAAATPVTPVTPETPETGARTAGTVDDDGPGGAHHGDGPGGGTAGGAALSGGQAAAGEAKAQGGDAAGDGDDGGEATDPNEDVDRALVELLGNASRLDEFDLTSGLAGFGAYALERWPGDLASACLTLVCQRLAQLAVPQEVGYAWRTADWLLHSDERRSFSQGMFDLGVAHGLPGVLPILAQAAAAGAAPDSARELLRGAVRWLLSRKLPAGGTAVYPGAWGPGVAEGPARAAWCYGDPGIAATLLVAARAAGEPAWEAEAIRLARTAARREPGDGKVRDACLCHGAAGLGHLFNRVYQATGDPELLAAARGWMERALDLRQPGRGIGGFVTWGPDASDQMGWCDEPTLLSGAAGVALALLAATTAIEPAWDRFLLISPAVAPAAIPAPGMPGTGAPGAPPNNLNDPGFSL